MADKGRGLWLGILANGLLLLLILDAQEGIAGNPVQDTGTGDAAHDGLDGAIALDLGLFDLNQRADAEDIIGAWLIYVSLTLGGRNEAVIAGVGLPDRKHGL